MTEVAIPLLDPSSELGPRDDLKMAPPDETTGSDVTKNGKQDGRKVRNKNNYRRRRRTNSFKRTIASAAWQERKEDARRRRAAVRRQSLGLPVAPYNTTQFLMEEHKSEQPDEAQLNAPRRRRGDSFNSIDSSEVEELCSSYDEDEEYLHAQFREEYENIHNERLHSMSKAELVAEFLLLEARIDSLEHELRAVKEAEENDLPMEVTATEEDIQKIRVFQQEIDKLQAENLRLKLENETLRQRLVDDANSLEVHE